MSSAVAIFIPMLEKSRRSYFNDNKSLSQVDKAAFTIMYYHARNPHLTDINKKKKIFLTPLKNYYTQRGNTFYNI